MAAALAAVSGDTNSILAARTGAGGSNSVGNEGEGDGTCDECGVNGANNRGIVARLGLANAGRGELVPFTKSVAVAIGLRKRSTGLRVSLHTSLAPLAFRKSSTLSCRVENAADSTRTASTLTRVQI